MTLPHPQRLAVYTGEALDQLAAADGAAGLGSNSGYTARIVTVVWGWPLRHDGRSAMAGDAREHRGAKPSHAWYPAGLLLGAEQPFALRRACQRSTAPAAEDSRWGLPEAL